MDELEQDYVPHAQKVFDNMRVQDGYTSSEFVELVDILSTHQIVRMETTNAIAVHANGVYSFANAAKKISETYGEADAYSSATAAYVEKLMTDASPLRDDPGTKTFQDRATPAASAGAINTESTGTTYNPGTTALGSDGRPLY
jgi:hypothetical protein